MVPGNPELEVFKELPDNYEEDLLGLSSREASIKGDCLKEPLDVLKKMHHCGHCGGWIDALPIQESVYEPLVNLTGRQGTFYYCARCGYELCFVGRMS